MKDHSYLKKTPEKKEVFVGQVKLIEDTTDVLTDKGEYLQDILYHMYDDRKVRITIELID